ncbi:MAG: hypothetical protein AAGA48_05280 [Myxococcota bacterium]
MQRLLVGILVLGGSMGLLNSAFALPGVPTKVPKTPDAANVPDLPDLPDMTVADMLKALDDADRKLTRSADRLFDSEMKLLEALGRADMALDYRKKIAALQAKGTSVERDAEMLALTTDQAIIDAMVEALKDKANKMNDERKRAARDATLGIAVARLMALATTEDAGTVSGATIKLNQRLASGDDDAKEEVAEHASNGPVFVTGLGARAGGIKKAADAMASQSKEVSQVMDKYRKKKSLFAPISAEEPKKLLEQSGF